jgi:hypothetical protein
MFFMCVIEHVICSNRGACNTHTGLCVCSSGYRGPACSDGDNIAISYGDSSALSVSVLPPNFNSTGLSLTTTRNSGSDFRFFDCVANDTSVAYLRGDGAFAVTKIDSITFGETISSSGLYITGGLTVTTDPMQVFFSSIVTPVARIKALYQGAYTGSYLGYTAVNIDTVDRYWKDFNYIVMKNRGVTNIKFRADGAVFSSGGGLFVTNGLSVFHSGLSVTGGCTIDSGSVSIRKGGVSSQELNVNSNGMMIISGGFQITGGVSINSGGFRVVGGISQTSSATFAGLHVTNGLSLLTSGLKASGGITVNSGGAILTTGGLTIQTGGINIGTGGLTIQILSGMYLFNFFDLNNV